MPKFAVGDKVKTKIARLPHGIRMGDTGEVSKAPTGSGNVYEVSFNGTAYLSFLESELELAPLVTPFIPPISSYFFTPISAPPSADWSVVSLYSTPLVEPFTHNCKDNLKRYVGIMDIFDYCTQCDAKFRENV